VTVFRNLNDLADAGALARVDLGDHTWRFEIHHAAKSRGIEHPHFVCDHCRSVSCLAAVNVRVSPRPGSRRSIIGKVSAVVLKGRCRLR
ncbi:MAG: transcriptional repressor, partial [Candidatus Binataceae bacterium]